MNAPEPLRVSPILDELHQLDHATTRSIALLAHVCGWAIVTGTKGWRLYGPDRNGEMTLPNDSGLRDSRYKSMVRQIVRNGAWRPSDDELAVIAEMTKLDRQHLRTMREVIEGYRDEVRELVDATRDDPEARVHRMVEQPTQRPAAEQVLAEPVLARGPVPPTIVQGPTIVSKMPWRAAHMRARGTTYESQTTMERQWSNGAIDYQCRFEGCGWVADNPRSVARHYGGSHSEGKAPQPPVDGFDPSLIGTETHQEGRRAARIERLAAELRRAWESGLDVDAELASMPELCRALAMKVIDARIAADDLTDAQPAELTAEQTLARIAVLVDRGMSAELRRQLEVEQARAEVAEANLSALAELLTPYHREGPT